MASVGKNSRDPEPGVVLTVRERPKSPGQPSEVSEFGRRIE